MHQESDLWNPWTWEDLGVMSYWPLGLAKDDISQRAASASKSHGSVTFNHFVCWKHALGIVLTLLLSGCIAAQSVELDCS